MVKCSLKELKLFIPGIVSFGLISVIILSSITALLLYVEKLPIINILKDEYIHHVILSSVRQACISTFASIISAIFIARAFYRQKSFIGRKFLIKFMSLSFIMPSIIIVFGLAIIYGKSGWANQFLSIFNINLGYYLYGMFGVVMGHMVFCLPLAIRVILNALENIPEQNWRIAYQLGLSRFNMMKIVELPTIIEACISIALLIFMMCFTSFAIVLALGGGIHITTIEVAIYQALKFDFDLSRATILAMLQLIICLSFSIFIYKKRGLSFAKEIKETSNIIYFMKYNNVNLIIDSIFIFIGFILLIVPVIAICISGIKGFYLEIFYTSSFWNAFSNSCVISLLTGILTVSLAIMMLHSCYVLKYKYNYKQLDSKISFFSNVILAIPTYIIATGLFILLKDVTNLFDGKIYVVMLMNSIMTLPFALSILYPHFVNITDSEVKLCKNLGIRGISFFQNIFWYKIKKPMGFALALSVASSWGDLGAIALFSNTNLTTLPLLLYNKFNNYHFDEASFLAMFILLISFITFIIIEALFTEKRRTKNA